MHRRKGAIEQKQQDPSTIPTGEPEKPDLNKIIMDLHTITKVCNNLALALSVYAHDRGELDTSKFNLIKQDQVVEKPKQGA